MRSLVAVLCATPAYFQQHGIPRRIDDLRKHECVLFSPLVSKRGWTFLHNKRRVSIPVTGTFEIDEMEAVYATVNDGFGIGILSQYMAGAAIRQGHLIPVLRNYRVTPQSAIYLVYLPNRSLPSRVRALIEFLVDRFGTSPPWEAG